MDNYTLYEDELLYVILMKQAAAVGHVKITPKKGVRFIDELPSNEVNHFFIVASKVASGIFEGLGAQGTNIIVNNGFKEHFEIDIIPRSEGDNLNFQWKMDRASPEELDKIQKQMNQHTEYIGINSGNEIPKEQKQIQQTQNQVEQTSIQNKTEVQEQPEEEDYRIRQLRREV